MILNATFLRIKGKMVSGNWLMVIESDCLGLPASQ